MSADLTREQARDIARILWTARQRRAREAEEQQVASDLPLGDDDDSTDKRDES